MRLLSRNGTDWTKRYPWIAEAALKNRQKRFVIDGEAVILGVDGISDFNALHSRQHDHEVQLYAFDVLVMGGDDLRSLPLHMRKTNPEHLLARRPDGDHCGAHRAGRDRARSIPSCLPGGSGRAGFQASRSAVPWRPTEALDQGEEPEPPSDGKGAINCGPPAEPAGLLSNVKRRRRRTRRHKQACHSRSILDRRICPQRTTPLARPPLLAWHRA